MAESETKRARKHVVDAIRARERALDDEERALEAEKLRILSKEKDMQERKRRLQEYEGKIERYRETLKHRFNPGLMHLVIGMLQQNSPMTIQTLGRISTLTHHAYDDLLLPLWEEVFRTEADWTEWAWEHKYIRQQYEDDDDVIYQPEDTMGDENVGIVLKSDPDVQVLQNYDGPMTDAFRTFLDSVSPPEKRGIESTYWKRAVEYMKRTNLEFEMDIQVHWTPYDIIWIQSRLDSEDGVPVIERVEWSAKDEIVRFCQDKVSTDFTRVMELSVVGIGGIQNFFNGAFWVLKDNKDVRFASVTQRSSVFFAKLSGQSTIKMYLESESIGVFRDGAGATKKIARSQYGFAVNPDQRHICFMTPDQIIVVYDSLDRKETRYIATAPIQASELSGKFYWSKDGSSIYMSYKSGVVVYRPDVPPVYFEAPGLIDFELSHDDATLFLVTEKEWVFQETTAPFTKRSQNRTNRGEIDYVCSCFVVNRPQVWIVRKRKADGYCQVVSMHAFTSLVSHPVDPTRFFKRN